MAQSEAPREKDENRLIEEWTMKLKVVRVYVHGACRGNPGLSAIGILVCTVTDKVLKEHSEAIGEHTNHEAEYLALIRSLEVASEYTKSKAQVFLNNLVEARQSTGEYKVKQARLLPLRDKVVRLAEEIEDVFEYAEHPLTVFMEQEILPYKICDVDGITRKKIEEFAELERGLRKYFSRYGVAYDVAADRIAGYRGLEPGSYDAMTLIVKTLREYEEEKKLLTRKGKEAF